jgi:hypothetical protein
LWLFSISRGWMEKIRDCAVHSPMDVAGARTCVDIPWELRPSLA